MNEDKPEIGALKDYQRRMVDAARASLKSRPFVMHAGTGKAAHCKSVNRLLSLKPSKAICRRRQIDCQLFGRIEQFNCKATLNS